jgi:hypothetical protein
VWFALLKVQRRAGTPEKTKQDPETIKLEGERNENEFLST